MNDDLSIKWTLANPLSIQMDGPGNAWNSGAARDIAALDEDRVLVATDTGSIWIANRDGSSIAVADDLDSPDFCCLTAGLYEGNDHFYAGGGKLYETNISKTLPLLNWREIPVTWQNKDILGKPYTASPSTIYRIVVLRSDKRIVLATTDGVVWADIPKPPSRPSGCLLFGGKKGTAPGTYTWKKAQGLDDYTLGYLGLTAGAAASGEIEQSVTVASWGYMNGKTLEAMQFYRGVWEGGELVMKKANMGNVEGIDNSLARATTITSCDMHRERMYAISSSDGVGAPAMFWTSTDDGRNWVPSIPKLIHPSDKTFAGAAGQFGNSFQRPCNAIAASRQNRDIVIVVWRVEGLFVSEDGGKSFSLTDTTSSAHVHADVHAVYFDPTDFAGERVFIAHDGGISMFPGLGKDPLLVESMYNRQLATLQFQTAPGRMFYGGASASPAANGAMIGGLQDNGVVTCSIQPLIEPWITTDGGDGFQTTFLSHGQALWNNNDETYVPEIGIVRHSFWSAGHRLVLPSYIPVWKFDPEMPYLIGLPMAPGETVVFASIHIPKWTNSEGEKMYAIAGKRSALYGLFYTEMGTQPRWEFLGRFSLNDNLTADQIKEKNWEPWAISAVASFDGGRIYVGTKGGRLIAFDQAAGVALEITVPLRKNSWGDVDSVISRIVVANDNLAFATYNLTRSRPTGASHKWVKKGYVLRIKPPHSEVLKSLPVDGYYGVEVAREPEHVCVYACTDSDVYVSRDPNGSLDDFWLRASQGLPKTAPLWGPVLCYATEWRKMALFKYLWEIFLEGSKMMNKEKNYLIEIEGGPEPEVPSVAARTHVWIQEQIRQLAHLKSHDVVFYLEAAKQLNVLPLSSIDSIRWYGVRPNGDVLSFNIHTPHDENIEEDTWQRSAVLLKASEVFPELSPLVPPTPLNSRPCPRCGGGGKIQLRGEWVVCICEGLGWLPPMFDEIRKRQSETYDVQDKEL